MYEKYLSELTEERLFQLIASRYTGLVDLNKEDSSTPIDWYWPQEDIWIEAKCRQEHYPTLFIEKIKYDKLISKKNSWYLNSTPQGIYVFVLQEMEEPYWIERKMMRSKFFSTDKDIITKVVGELSIKKASFQLEHLLLK
jgi:hypothetical protein